MKFSKRRTMFLCPWVWQQKSGGDLEMTSCWKLNASFSHLFRWKQTVVSFSACIWFLLVCSVILSKLVNNHFCLFQPHTMEGFWCAQIKIYSMFGLLETNFKVWTCTQGNPWMLLNLFLLFSFSWEWVKAELTVLCKKNHLYLDCSLNFKKTPSK